MNKYCVQERKKKDLCIGNNEKEQEEDKEGDENDKKIMGIRKVRVMKLNSDCIQTIMEHKAQIYNHIRDEP